jgi:hypothetical protein
VGYKFILKEGYGTSQIIDTETGENIANKLMVYSLKLSMDWDKDNGRIRLQMFCEPDEVEVHAPSGSVEIVTAEVV